MNFYRANRRAIAAVASVTAVLTPLLLLLLLLLLNSEATVGPIRSIEDDLLNALERVLRLDGTCANDSRRISMSFLRAL